MIEIIYTTIEKNPNIASKQDRLFVNLDSKCYPYRCYDVVTYKHLKQVIEVYKFFIKLYGGYENLPAVFIDGYYIGGYDNFQELEELKLTNNIVTREYLRRCLECNIIRTNKDFDTCPYCYKNYLFFIKSENRLSIHENRFNSDEIIYIN
jgi:glutaredoxin